MRLLFAAVLVASLSSSAFAVEESQSLALAKSLINTNSIEGKQFWRQGQFSSAHGSTKTATFHVRYLKFGDKRGSRGSVVIAPGRTESSAKYIEVAYDFIKRGYSPVYAIDHRGQGFSDRMLVNMNKGYVKDFEDYVDDFEQFVNTVVLKDSAVASHRLFLLSNSMGGAITTSYLERVSAKSPFLASVMVSPMLEISFDGGLTESRARLQTSLICLSGLKLMGKTCDSYADDRGQDYDPSERNIDAGNPQPGNLTHSVPRYQYRNFLWDEKWPFLALGGATVRWVWQATKANQEMRESNQLVKIQTPVMIVSGTQDVVVNIIRHNWYCQQLTALGKTCVNVTIPDGYHELLMETDSMRTPAMNAVWNFFESL